MLFDGEKVSQDLSRVLVIGKAVDDRNRTVLCKIYDVLVGEGSDHDTVNHAGQYVSCVMDGFATSDLDIVAGKEESVAAELVHADLEGDTCSCRRLGKDHAESLAGKDRMRDARFGLRLQIDRGLKERIELRDGYVLMKINVDWLKMTGAILRSGYSVENYIK